MRRILLIAGRDYLASVRTKAFIIGLLLAPLLFGGSFLATTLMRGKPTNEVRRVAVVDKTGVAAASVVKQIEQQNKIDGFDKRTGARIMPRYDLETVAPDEHDPNGQLLALSNRVRDKDLFGFLEIGPNSVEWYSNEGGFGQTKDWLAGPVNDALARIHLSVLGIKSEQLDQALKPVPVESMSLLARDEKSGQVVPARKRGEAEGFAAPFVLAILFFMIVLLASAPMLSAVAEDKTQRVFEMLLASASPFDLIAGKILAAVGTALTSSIFYIAGALLLLQALAMSGLAPLQVIPWFFIYLAAEVMMLSSVATALGAACTSTRDAENLKMIVIMPVMIPILVLTPILSEPNGALATGMSLFPLFTPILMLIRQAAPGGVPAWQPWVGLTGVLITTVAVSWLASRIFRVALLFQGKTPNVAELFRWGLNG